MLLSVIFKKRKVGILTFWKYNESCNGNGKHCQLNLCSENVVSMWKCGGKKKALNDNFTSHINTEKTEFLTF